jgi:hypothetical protein
MAATSMVSSYEYNSGEMVLTWSRIKMTVLGRPAHSRITIHISKQLLSTVTNSDRPSMFPKATRKATSIK